MTRATTSRNTGGERTRGPMGTYPVYLFALADAGSGTLYLNTFGRWRYPSARQLREAEEIVAHLRVEHRAGPLDVIKIGWGGDGRRPLDAVDTDDVRIMAGWISRAYVTDVHLDVDAPILADAERASA